MPRQEPYITQKAGLMAGEERTNILVLGHHDLDLTVISRTVTGSANKADSLLSQVWKAPCAHRHRPQNITAQLPATCGPVGISISQNNSYI